jgi:hypothetical protein
MRARAIRSVCVWTFGLAVLVWWGRQGPLPAEAPAAPGHWAAMRAARTGLVDVVLGALPDAAAAPADETGYRPVADGLFLPHAIGGAGSAAPIVTIEPSVLMPRMRARENTMSDLGGALPDEPLRDWGWLNAAVRETERLDRLQAKPEFGGAQAGWDLLDPRPNRDVLPMDRMLEPGNVPGAHILFED